MLLDRVKQIKDNIKASCDKAQRSSESVTLVAVTKTVGSDQMKELVKLGISNLAENRVDKLLEKQKDLAEFPEISWHFIGNLQRRKVKSVINQIDYFHALDSVKLAAEIEKRAEHTIKCFVEVNVSEEETKQGLTLSEVEGFIRRMADFPSLSIVGLMTMAPLGASEEEITDYFKQLYMKQQSIQALKLSHAPCQELSMGMSQDYSLAIQAGATFIRVGTAFFQSVNREGNK